MPPEASAFVGLLGGVAIGAAYHHVLARTPNPHGAWLGRTCWVRPCARETWAEHVVVACSWHGAVCVRRAGEGPGEGYWIKKENVGWRVRWDAPGEGTR